MIRRYIASLAVVFWALCAPTLALAQLDPQNMSAPTLPLAGTEVIPCNQGGGYKKCLESNIIPQSTIAGQVLTAGGPGNAPTWQNLPSNPYNPGLPQQSTWTLLNSSLLTVQQTAVNGSGFVQAISLSSPYAAGNNIMGLCRPAPTAPYLIAVALTAQMPNGNGLTGNEDVGFGYYDATSGKLELLAEHTGTTVVPSLEKWNSVTSNSSKTDGTAIFGFGIWFGIQNDGTTLHFLLSADSVNWIPFQTDSVSGGWMPNVNTICIIVNPNISGGSGTYPVTYFTYDINGSSRTLASVY